MVPVTPKMQYAILTASTTNGGTASGFVDCKGHDFYRVQVHLTTSNAVTNNPSVLTLSHGDSTSAFTAISTGDTDFTIPDAITAATSITGPFVVFEGPVKRRYLRVAVSPLTTQLITASVDLFRSRETPDTDSEAGASEIVRLT